jgi:hypothetical protein
MAKDHDFKRARHGFDGFLTRGLSPEPAACAPTKQFRVLPGCWFGWVRQDAPALGASGMMNRLAGGY